MCVLAPWNEWQDNFHIAPCGCDDAVILNYKRQWFTNATIDLFDYVVDELYEGKKEKSVVVGLAVT